MAPIAAFAEIKVDEETRLHLQARVLSTDGKQQLAEVGSCVLDATDLAAWPDAARQLATQVSQRLEKSGAKELVQQAR